MALTYFLAQVIGLYLLIVGLTMLFWKKRWMNVLHEFCQSQGETLRYMLGIVALPFGLLLVLVHNYWNMGVLALVVTLFGWIILLKSILVLFVFSPEQMGRLVKVFWIEQWWYVYVVIMLIIGAYLTHAGFTQTGLLH